MARRKKAPDGFHKEQIAAAAGRLFIEKGIKGTSMDDIVKESGYGKATLYAYFKNKNEIVSVLALDSMKKLLENIKKKVNEGETIKEQYLNICETIVEFQENFPEYFIISISMINVDSDEIGKQACALGEEINMQIEKILKRGIEQGVLKEDLLIPQTIFSFWAAITGIIAMSKDKEDYINKTINVDRNGLLKYAFNLLFKALERE